MKKLLLIIFVLAVSTQIHAKIKAKHIVGSWTYAVNTPDGDLTGELKFTEVDKKLNGVVHTDDGSTFTMSKIEIKDGDVLYFEIQPDYEIWRISLNMTKDKYDGTGTKVSLKSRLPAQKRNRKSFEE